jgi:hypothetical protein
MIEEKSQKGLKFIVDSKESSAINGSTLVSDLGNNPSKNAPLLRRKFERPYTVGFSAAGNILD